MTFAITGVTGFVGSFLARFLAGRGHTIVGIGRRALPEDNLLRSILETYQCIPLESSADLHSWWKIDCLIHGAYDTHPGREEINLQGTARLAHLARENGVKQQILLSSYAALRPASSGYAQIKAALEQSLRSVAATVVRPGLIIGEGGLYGRMRSFILKYPILPLLNGGANRVPLVDITDLSLAVEYISKDIATGAFNLFMEDVPTLREVLTEIRSKCRRQTLFVPVPTLVALAPIALAERAGIRLSITTNNLRGLVSNDQVAVRSDLSTFIPNPRAWRDCIH